jgi:hypothetical protein
MGSPRLLLLLLLALTALCACGGGGGDDDDDGGSSGGGPPPGGSPGVDFPLRLSANGRLLEDQNGDPFLLHGDSAWSAEVRLTTAKMVEYLDDREQRGFNAILIEAMEHRFNGSCTVDLNCWNNANGDAPFTVMNPDVAFDSPNPNYWDQVDTLLDLARDRGMVVLMTPTYLGAFCTDEGWARKMHDEANDAEMRAFGRFLGERYQSQDNLIWVHGGDSHPDNGGCNGLPELESRIDALEDGINDFENTFLRTAHDNRGYSANDRYGDRPWLDLNNTYSDCGSGSTYFPDSDASALQVREDYQLNPPRPFIYVEGRYENEGGADLRCLVSQAYWAMLGGATGQIFGNSPIWFFGFGWENALDSPGAQAMTALRELIDSRPWDELVPDYGDAIVTAGRGAIDSEDYVAAASTPDGNLLVVFVPEARTIDVDLSQLSGANVDVWSYDPTDGSVSLLGTFPTAARTFNANGLEVLVFDNAALGRSAPGS